MGKIDEIPPGGLGNSPISGRLGSSIEQEAKVKKKEADGGAEVKRLRRRVEALKSEVALWRTRYFDLQARTLLNLKAGVREDEVLSKHPAIRKSIEAADRDFRKKGGISLEAVINGLEMGRAIPRELRSEFLSRFRKDIGAHPKKQGMTKEKILAEFEAWKKARHH